MHIHDMAEIVFRETYRNILSAEQIDYMMDWMYSPSSLKRQMEEGHAYYIAWSDDRACAYVSIQREGLSDDGYELFHLQKIYILPSHQGCGLGRQLFDTAVSHARSESKGMKARIELNVNRKNPAVGFYKNLGMEICREGDFHIGEGYYMNDYIMGIDI